MAKAKKRVVKKATKRKALVILPTKMSTLIGIALKDMRKVEKESKKYVVDMSEWYYPGKLVECKVDLGDDDKVVIDSFEVCSVCFAGSVMAFTLGGSAYYSHPGEGTPAFVKNEKQLLALNELREGNVTSALDHLNEDTVNNLKAGSFNRHIPEYDRKDPEPFHKAMAKLQADLKKGGL